MITVPIEGDIGRVLGGRYRLIAPIGSGASARVYLAEDVTLRRQVAVKMLHAGLADDPAFLRRFRAEAQAAASLNSPNVVGVYDWGHDGVPYLVTEYLGGGSLRSMLDAGNRLTPSQALLVGLEAARGLDDAHSRGLVHRDIKPANLLFATDGRLRIADFGLARALAEAGWTEEQGTLVGTARYAAPEQARGERVGPAADLYALALTINEAVCGEVPFVADTVVGTLMARAETPFEPHLDTGPLMGMLRAAGALDPADRPSAEAFASALMDAAGGLPRPARLPLAESAIAGTDMLDETRHGTLHVVPDRGAASSGPASPVEETAPARRWPWAVLLLAIIVAAVAAGVSAWQGGQSDTAALPDVAGMNRPEAITALAEYGWELGFTDVREPGTVLDEVVRTDPTAGAELEPGAAVEVFVSLGEPLVMLPDPTGLTLGDARSAIESVGLVLGDVRETDDEVVAAGLVVEWRTPGQAVELEPGTAVDLVLSTGPAQRVVPDLPADGSAETAAAQLAELRLVPVTDSEFSETVPAGTIIRFEPSPGAFVGVDTEILVVVSDGPAPRPIPAVLGLDVLEATAILQEAGFEVIDVQGPPDRPVLATDPAAGEVHAFGTRVVIATSLTAG